MAIRKTVVRKVMDDILSKTDVDERIAAWAQNRKNNFSIAVEEMPYVCLALVLIGFSVGFPVGFIVGKLA
jgi:hypothetical protein